MNRVFRFIRFVFVKNAFKKIKTRDLCDAVVASYASCLLRLVIVLVSFYLSALGDKEICPHFSVKIKSPLTLFSVAAVILGFVGKFGTFNLKIPKKNRKAKLLNEKISLLMHTMTLMLQLQVSCGLFLP